MNGRWWEESTWWNSSERNYLLIHYVCRVCTMFVCARWSVTSHFHFVQFSLRFISFQLGWVGGRSPLLLQSFARHRLRFTRATHENEMPSDAVVRRRISNDSQNGTKRCSNFHWSPKCYHRRKTCRPKWKWVIKIQFARLTFSFGFFAVVFVRGSFFSSSVNIDRSALRRVHLTRSLPSFGSFSIFKAKHFRFLLFSIFRKIFSLSLFLSI